jgi:hypothetical protein
MRTSWPDAPELPHRAKPRHSKTIGYDEMSPPATPVLGNGTLTLPLNPNRFPKSRPPAAIVRARHGVDLREDDEGLASTQVGQRPMITMARSVLRFRLCVQVNPQIVPE